MAAYIARRLLLSVFTIVMISMLSFFIIELPEGDLAAKRHARTLSHTFSIAQTDAMTDELRRYLGLDRPIYVRYGLWVWNMMQGDLGRSFPDGGTIVL